MKKNTLLCLLLFCSNLLAAANTSMPSEKVVKDAYYYFLARLLILRQEHIDFKDNGFQWNKLFHREVGEVSWANPNLDVAYSEAWIGLDEKSCAVVDIPFFKDRYYTFQVLNSWGETVANVNDRNFPNHPVGKFALCTKDSVVKLEKDTVKIPLTGSKFRVLSRVELGKDKDEAEKLQRQIKLSMIGKPKIAEPIRIPMFNNKSLIGVEAFVSANEILKSEPDTNPGMKPLQEKVIRVAKAIQIPQNREKVQLLLQQKIIPEFFKDSERLGKSKGGWIAPAAIGSYGKNYLSRSYTNLAGIWANTKAEATYFTARYDKNGNPLNGSNVYSITFPKEKLPQNIARYFWSIVATDAVDFHVIPNDNDKYIINDQTKLKANKDGSITLVLASKLPEGVDEDNWLPLKEGQNFNLAFRIYGPLDKKYFPPEINVSEKFKQAQEE